MLGVSVIGFALMHLAPGGPLAMYTLNPTVTAQDIERIKAQFGLDQPVSCNMSNGRPACSPAIGATAFSAATGGGDVVLERIPATLELMGTSLASSLVIGVAIGVLAAVRRDSCFDYATAVRGDGGPVAADLLVRLLGIYHFRADCWVGCRPAVFAAPAAAAFLDALRHLILPVAGAGARACGAMEPLHPLRDDRHPQPGFHAHGARQGPVGRARPLSHGLRAALVPLVTLVGLQLPLLVGGALVTETVFSWPGMGLLFVNALGRATIRSSWPSSWSARFVVVLGNLIADVVIALIDPRIKAAHV